MFATWFSQNPGGILLHTKDFYLQLQIVKYTRLHTSNKTIFKNMWSMLSVLQSRFFTPLQIPPKSYDICNTTFELEWQFFQSVGLKTLLLLGEMWKLLYYSEKGFTLPQCKYQIPEVQHHNMDLRKLDYKLTVYWLWRRK